MTKTLKKTLVVLGAGGHGRSLADAAKAMDQWQEIIFLDDNTQLIETSENVKVVGKIADLPLLFSPESADVALGLGVGLDQLRLETLKKYQAEGFHFPPIIHPSTSISPLVTIGAGSLIMPGTVINPDVSIGKGCIINIASSIGHDCRIEDGVQIASGVHIGGHVSIGQLSWIGIGATIIHNLTLGREILVAAGAVVTKGIQDKQRMAGVPAKPMQKPSLSIG